MGLIRKNENERIFRELGDKANESLPTRVTDKTNLYKDTTFSFTNLLSYILLQGNIL